MNKLRDNNGRFNKGSKMPLDYVRRRSKLVAGAKNKNWKGGISVSKCADCGKETKMTPVRRTINVIRCQNCYFSFLRKSHPLKGTKRVGEKCGRWKGGISIGDNKKEYFRKKTLERIARKHGALGSHTQHEWLALKIKYGFMCLCCKRTEPEIALSEDHIVPLIKGGRDDIANIQPLCGSCNSRKFTATIDYRIGISTSR